MTPHQAASPRELYPFTFRRMSSPWSQGPGPPLESMVPPPAGHHRTLTVLLAVEVLRAPHPLVLAGTQAGGQVWVS